MARKRRRIGALDLETDPFKHGRDIKPFCWGFYDGRQFDHGWKHGAGCISSLINYLETLEDDFLIYAHNGGKFDFLFLLPHLDAHDIRVISGRIVEAKLGRHILRDSFAILPVKLKQAGAEGSAKLDIDMAKLEPGRRERHRAEIVEYLRGDCVTLYDAVTAFRDRFGNSLTMAGAAIKRLKASVERETGRAWREVLQPLTLARDAEFRPFFFGGRVECFERGVIADDLEIRDVNSMYPYVMAEYEHPVGSTFIEQRAIDDRTDFAIIHAHSDGALPLRAKDGSLSFPRGLFRFHATGHEIRQALALGTLRIHKVEWAARCGVRMSFSAFVNEYYDLRMQAEKMGDERAKLHFKLVLNSSYGRFALDADKLRDWRIVDPRAFMLPHGHPDALRLDDLQAEGWTVGFEGPGVWMMERPVDDMTKARALLNVATGASITGAARAMMQAGIAHATRPIYCDTDSLICRRLDMPTGKALGMWKHEGNGDECAVAGKKLYAVWADGQAIKSASKGVRLSPEQIRLVAEGHVIRWHAEAPTFNVAGGFRYLHRDVRMTA